MAHINFFTFNEVLALLSVGQQDHFLNACGIVQVELDDGTYLLLRNPDPYSHDVLYIKIEGDPVYVRNDPLCGRYLFDELSKLGLLVTDIPAASEIIQYHLTLECPDNADESGEEDDGEDESDYSPSGSASYIQALIKVLSMELAQLSGLNLESVRSILSLTNVKNTLQLNLVVTTRTFDGIPTDTTEINQLKELALSLGTGDDSKEQVEDLLEQITIGTALLIRKIETNAASSDELNESDDQ